MCKLCMTELVKCLMNLYCFIFVYLLSPYLYIYLDGPREDSFKTYWIANFK